MEEIVVDDAPGLAWIVNLGCIELHPHPFAPAILSTPTNCGSISIRFRVLVGRMYAVSPSKYKVYSKR